MPGVCDDSDLLYCGSQIVRIKLTACETDTGEWKGRRVKKMYSSNFKSMSHKKEQLEVLLIIVFDPGGGEVGNHAVFYSGRSSTVACSLC